MIDIIVLNEMNSLLIVSKTLRDALGDKIGYLSDRYENLNKTGKRPQSEKHGQLPCN